MPTAFDTVTTLLGWVGAVGGVSAYAMVTRGKWTACGLPFQLTNFVAAGFLCTTAARGGVWPSVAANVVWMAVGVQAFIVIARGRHRRGAGADDVPAAEPAVAAGESAYEVDVSPALAAA